MERLTINGQAAKATYGFVLEDGSYSQLFQGLKAKTKYSHNWNDEHGEDVDPNEVTRFESIAYTFSILFSAISYSDFNTKYNAFVDTLKASNGSVWHFPELAKTYRLHLQEISNLIDIDLMNGKAKVTIQLKNNWQI